MGIIWSFAGRRSCLADTSGALTSTSTQWLCVGEREGERGRERGEM